MPDREFLILSATEPDRAGLVADLTAYIAERHCNVEDSRIVVLGGYAGLMFLLSGPPEGVQAVIDGLEQLRERSRIRAIPRRVAARRPAEGPGLARYAIEASAIDREGLVHTLADLVRRLGGNILELETSTESAPMSGEPLFAMRMLVTLAEGGGAAERFERELERLAQAEAMDLELRRLDRAAKLPSLSQG